MLNAEQLNVDIQKYYTSAADRENLKVTQKATSIRLSSFGACARKWFYKFTEPEYSLPWYSPYLVNVFQAGQKEETYMRRFLEDMGYTIEMQQRPIFDEEMKGLNISGHSEWRMGKMIDSEMHWVLAEVKSFGTYMWKHIRNETNIECFRDSDTYWLRGYYDQLQGYMAGLHVKKAVMIGVNRNADTLPHCLDATIDPEYIEGMKAKAFLINAAVASGEPPEKLKWCSECVQCPFRNSTCHQVEEFKPITHFTEEDTAYYGPLKGMIETWSTGQETKKSCTAAWAGIKGMLDSFGDCEEFHIDGFTIRRPLKKGSKMAIKEDKEVNGDN